MIHEKLLHPAAVFFMRDPGGGKRRDERKRFPPKSIREVRSGRNLSTKLRPNA